PAMCESSRQGGILAIQRTRRGAPQGMKVQNDMSGPDAPHKSGKARPFFRVRDFISRGRKRWGHVRRALYRTWRHRWFRRASLAFVSVVAVMAVTLTGFWWRLGNGPIELDLATPWLASAIAENFGAKHTVTVGGTQIERAEDGHTAVRLRDIVVRDADGV